MRVSRRQFMTMTAGVILVGGMAYRRIWAGGPDSDVEFLTPIDPAYEARRQPFNKTITLKPKVIALCHSEAGVQKAVRHAIEHNLPIAVKSGGHSFEGFSLNGDGLVIDLSGMKAMQFKDGETFIAGPGCTLSEVYDFILPQHRILPLGSCGGVGLAGLTLGGGYGLLSRKFGLTCDHLTHLRMVDGKGTIVDTHTNPDLLWACRGGGNGHFGVVTEMSFTTHPAPKTLTRYLCKFQDLTPPKACELARRWFESTSRLPHDAFAAFVLNRKTLTLLVTTVEETPSQAMIKLTNELMAGSDKVHPVKTASLAESFPGYYGRREPLFFKNASAGYMNAFSDIQGIAEELFARVAATPGMIMQINTLGGAINSKEFAERSSYPHRARANLGELQCYWDEAKQTETRLKGFRDTQDVLMKAKLTGHYANYPDLRFKNWAEDYYSADNLKRLQAIKALHDPDNRFRHPQSVPLS
ncbi:MAG: FAD-binding oxidoreductase [Planctomycetota bacterium]